MLLIPRKRANILLTLLFIFVFITAQSALAEFDPDSIKSQNVLLVDAETGLVLFEKNADERAYPASTTKIMTGILTVENMTRDDLQEKITVGDEVRKFSSANTLLGNREGEELRGVDLLYSMMILSANDSAATLACHIGGSIEGFASMMNAKAAELGLESTNFVNPHGLHDENHYTTARDMAKLAAFALKNERLMSVINTGSYNCPPTNKRKDEKLIYSTNRFITDNPKYEDFRWSPVTGMKTGSTNAAKGCLVTSAEKDGKKLVCVLFGDGSRNYERRWTESRALLEYGFENLDYLPLSSLTLEPITVQVANASKSDETQGTLTVALSAGDEKVTLRKDDVELIKYDPSLISVTASVSPELSAPVEQGQKIGTAAIRYGDQTLKVIDLLAPRAVASIENDPVNPASSLIQSVVQTEKPDYTLRIIIIVLLVLVVLALLFVLIRSNRRMKRARRRRAMAAARRGQPAPRPRPTNGAPTSYYEYRRK